MTNSFLSRCYCCCYCLLLFVDAQNVLNNFVTDKQYFGAIKKRCLVLFNWWTTVVYISSHINFISLCFLFEITFSSICLVYGDGFFLGSILFDTRDAPFFTCAKKATTTTITNPNQLSVKSWKSCHRIVPHWKGTIVLCWNKKRKKPRFYFHY